MTTQNGKIIPRTQNKIPKLTCITASELAQMDIKPPSFLVEKILPVGLNVFAALPKAGKSWMSLYLAICISAGIPFLGFKTQRACVLYLSLEDSWSRLKARTEKILDGSPAPDNLSLCTTAATLETGLLVQLEEFMNERPNTKLIILDTLQKVRDGQQRAENAYASDYNCLGKLKSFADKWSVCVLVIHHLRKMKDNSDAFVNISGSNGISGASDTMWVLHKENRNDQDVTFSITGRDVESVDYLARFDTNTCKWSILGNSDDILSVIETEKHSKDPLILTVKKLLETSGGTWVGTASDVISASQNFNIPIFDSAQKVGKRISALQESLLQIDNIYYTPVSNGSGAKKHKFSRGFNSIGNFENNEPDNTTDVFEQLAL